MKKTLVEHFEQEMSSDDESFEKKSAQLKEIYENANLEQTIIIDNIFITLCGWSLGTLLHKAGEK